MSKELLLKRLNQLHHDLQTVKELDLATLDSLQRLEHDIRNLLGPKSQADTSELADANTIREQIERLEHEHPLAMRFVQQLSEGLASLGI